MEHMSAREFPLAPYGPRLGTRQEGRRVRGDLVQVLEGLPERGVLVVDLGGLEVLSGSFADEALVEAVVWLTERSGTGRYLVVRAPGAEEVEDLGARLSRRKLALLALLSDGPRALGHLPPYLAQALDLVHKRGAITSQELACELGVSVQGAAVRLASLARLRLVHPEPEARAMGGRQNRAVSLLPKFASPPA